MRREAWCGLLQPWQNHSCVRLFATPWTVAHQAPPSMGFSRQEYWRGLPLPSPGDLPDPGIEPRSPALEADALTTEPPGDKSLTRPQPHQPAGPGRQELRGAHASNPQVAPSRLGARLRALRSAGQNRSERGAKLSPDLLISPKQPPPLPREQKRRRWIARRRPTSVLPPAPPAPARAPSLGERGPAPQQIGSTRLNSSHTLASRMPSSA